MLVLSVVGAAIGLAIGTASWMARVAVPQSLQKF